MDFDGACSRLVRSRPPLCRPAVGTTTAQKIGNVNVAHKNRQCASSNLHRAHTLWHCMHHTCSPRPTPNPAHLYFAPSGLVFINFFLFHIWALSGWCYLILAPRIHIWGISNNFIYKFSLAPLYLHGAGEARPPSRCRRRRWPQNEINNALGKRGLFSQIPAELALQQRNPRKYTAFPRGVHAHARRTEIWVRGHPSPMSYHPFSTRFPIRFRNREPSHTVVVWGGASSYY